MATCSCGETVKLACLFTFVYCRAKLMFLMFFRVFLWVALGWHAARVLGFGATFMCYI